MTVGFDVAVEQHALALHVDTRGQDGRRPIVRAGKRRTALDAVLLALDGAPVVPPRALARRHGQIGLEGAGLDLVEDPLTQARQVCRPLLGEGVLGLEVRDDLGILLRPEPLVIVAHLVAMMTTQRRTRGGDGGGQRRGGRLSGHRSTLIHARRVGVGSPFCEGARMWEYFCGPVAGV